MNKQMATQVSAPGKIILFGEHSVVYGKLAIAGSLDIRTYVQIFENPDQHFEVEFENLAFKVRLNIQTMVHHLSLLDHSNEFNVSNPEFLKHENMLESCESFLKNNIEDFYELQGGIQIALMTVFYLIFGIFGSTNFQIGPILLKIKSELDVASGTGSSASFLVSVAASLLQYLKLKTTLNENVSKQNFEPFFFENVSKKTFDERELEIICKWAFATEKIIHGHPSGIDNTICTYGSMVEFRKGTPATLFNCFPLRILLIDSKIPKNTKKQVAKVRELYENYTDVLENIFRAMEDVAFLALNKLKELKENTEENSINSIFEELINLGSINHGLLSALGTSHPRLEEILLILNEYNLKGKLTGAGGGGYAISIIPPTFNNALIETVKNLLVQRGFGVILTNVGCEGVRVDF